MRNWKTRLKNILIICSATFLFFFQYVAIFSVFLYTKRSVGKKIVESFISEKAGSTITIDRIDYRLSPFIIRADSITISSTNEQSETNVFLKSLSLYGNVKGMIKQKELSFGKAEVNGAHVSIKLLTGWGEGSLDNLQGNLHKISEFDQYVQEIDIQDSSLDLTSALSEVKLQGVKGKLSATGKKNEFDVTLSTSSLSLIDNDRDLSLFTSLRAEGKTSLSASPSFKADFSFDQTTLISEGDTYTLNDTAFGIEGDLSSEKISLYFPHFTTSLSPFAHVTGIIQWSKSRNISFVTNLNIHVKDLDKTLQVLSPRYFPELRDFKLTGSADIEGKYSYVKGNEGVSNRIDGKLTLNPSKLVYISPHFSITNTVNGNLSFKGNLGQPDISGLIRISKGNLEWKTLRVQNLSMRCPISIQKNFQVKIPSFRGGINVLRYTLGNEEVGFDQIRFEGDMFYDLKKRRLTCDHLEIGIPPLPPLSLAADLSLKPAGEVFFHLKSSGLEYTPLSSIFARFLPQDLARWEPDASLDVEMSVTKPPGEKIWTINSQIDLTDIQFHNPSFTIAGESLAPRLVISGAYGPHLDRVPFSLELHLERGESLWDDYYIDWGKNPFSAKISGMYEPDSTRFPDLKADLSMPTLGKASAHGSISPGPQSQVNFVAAASSSNLQNILAFFSHHEESEDVDVILEGQALSEFHLEKSGDCFCLHGWFHINNGNFFREKQAISLRGINAKTPFYYQNKNIVDQDEGSNFSEKGFFSIDSFNFSNVSLNPLHLEFTSKANSFHLQPVALDFFGGKAVFGETIISLAQGISNINGSSSFTLDNLDLSRIPLKSGLFKFVGTAGADFPRVEIRPESISTQGQGYIDAYDGEITIHDLGLKKPFSKNRTATCNIEFSGLNLEKLTNSTPYGRVTGIIKGEIRNLAISYGQPESFSLSLESEKRKGIPQKFSTAAIKDLEILGTGGTTSMSSAKFLSRFISEFRYSKIGISCSLRNDVFTLRGTIKEDGTEYLVKNAWIFGISVINKKPQNQISFKDMVSRLKRIHQSQESR